jgi:hypothetical protein
MKQYIPKKNKGYGIQIYKLCNSTGYIRHECLHTAQYFTAPNATVTELTRQLEGQDHKVYRESFFSSPDLLADRGKKKGGGLSAK